MSNDALAKIRGAKPAVSTPPPSEHEKASYVNAVMFSGHLGRDPEYVKTPSGHELAKSSIGVFNPGSDEAKTMWFDLTMWLNETTTEKGRENTKDFIKFMEMKKGKEVVAEGRLTMRMYKEKPYYTITLSAIS